MAHITVEHLKIKPLASGFGYYWGPSARLARAGWEWTALGIAATRTDQALFDAARAINNQVAEWEKGGERPAAVKPAIVRSTMGALIASYRAEVAQRVEQWHLPPAKRDPTKGALLAPNTARAYNTALNIIERWTTAAAPIASITPPRVKVFRNALMTAGPDGIVPHHRAHNTLRVLRQLFAHGIAERMVPKDGNPAENFGLGAAPGRTAVWDVDGGRDDIEALARGAAAIGYPGLGLAAELAEYVGQREDDLLQLTKSNWRPVVLHDPVIMEALRGDDDELMGIFLGQAKTGVNLGIPIVGPLRRRIEAAIAVNLARTPAVAQILVDDVTGLPWRVRQFQRKFAEAKAWAIDPPAEARAMGVEPHPRLEDLHYSDFRRTCVVRMLEKQLESGSIRSITGHSHKTIETMKQIYGPGTTRQASIAILALHGRTARASDEQEQKRA